MAGYNAKQKNVYNADELSYAANIGNRRRRSSGGAQQVIAGANSVINTSGDPGALYTPTPTPGVPTANETGNVPMPGVGNSPGLMPSGKESVDITYGSMVNSGVTGVVGAPKGAGTGGASDGVGAVETDTVAGEGNGEGNGAVGSAATGAELTDNGAVQATVGAEGEAEAEAEAVVASEGGDVMDYPSFKSAEELAAETKETADKLAHTTYQEALKGNKTTYDRSVIEADTSYQTNIAPHGANSEWLANMGLDNSGYADYFKAQAYGQMRDDVQAAKAVRAGADSDAQAARSQSLAQNELLYKETLEGIESDKKEAYLTLLTGCSNGIYTDENVIREMARQIGLEDDVINTLIETARQYQAGVESDVATASIQAEDDGHRDTVLAMMADGYSYKNIQRYIDTYGVDMGEGWNEKFGAYKTEQDTEEESAKNDEYQSKVEEWMSAGYSPENIQHLIDSYGIVLDEGLQNQFNGYKQTYTKELYLQQVYNYGYESLDPSEVMNDENLSSEVKEELKKGYQNAILSGFDATTFFVNETGDGYLTKAMAREVMEQILADPWLNDDAEAKNGEPSNLLYMKNAIQLQYYQMYERGTNDNVRAINLSWNELDDVGDWFTVEADDGDNLWFKSGGDVSSQGVDALGGVSLKTVASDLPNQSLFMIGDKIYVKNGDRVYLVEARGGWTKDYEKLKGLFKPMAS